mmetsp:Transcript_12804/g.32313  ORF Transcript_12804/g.32313 Transcript_12804/m.32313 type:complete len:1091 (+) Transcript_12804:231-3503(+)
MTEDIDHEVEDRSNVTVAIRLKPPEDSSEDFKETFDATHTTVTVRDPLSRGRSEHHFRFSRVFTPEHGQEPVFDFVARPLIGQLLRGFNSCCFAYGQTGSGKTHSVFGEGNAEKRGMLARSIEYLFEKIEELARSMEVGMAVSFAEVYLDSVRDLGRFYVEKHGVGQPKRQRGVSECAIDGGHGVADVNGRRRAKTSHDDMDVTDTYLNQDLEIHESPQGLVYVEDLSLIPVSNIRDVLEVANLGVKMRATYETRLNARSSRSHTIFTLSVAQKSKNTKGGGIIASAVNFVDLAGSERLARSQSEGRRFQEAVVINTSLSALGKVVLALASNHRSHVPYRDSKLTRMLQNSLGGNSYTTLLATIDPSVRNYEESLNSLLFADRCKNVQNKPVQSASSEEGNSQGRTVRILMAELVELKRKLEMRPMAISPAIGSSSAPKSPQHQQQHQLQQQQQQQQQVQQAHARASDAGCIGDVVASDGSGKDVAQGGIVASNIAALDTMLAEDAAGGIGASAAKVAAQELQVAASASSGVHVASADASAPSAPVIAAEGITAPLGPAATRDIERLAQTLAAEQSVSQEKAALQGAKFGAAAVARTKESKQQAELMRQAKERLQMERMQTREICGKVDKAEEHVEQAWQEFYERDLERRHRVAELKKNIQEREAEIKRCTCSLHYVNTIVVRDNQNDIDSRDQFTTEVMKSRKSKLRNVPRELQQDTSDPSVVAQLDCEATMRLEARRNRSSNDIRALRESHGDDQCMFDAQQQRRLNSQEIECESVAAELELVTVSSRQSQQELHADLISAHDLIQQLRRLLNELSSGRTPAQQKTGVRRPQWELKELQTLLRGVDDDRDSNMLLDETALRKLRAGVAEIRKQLTRSQRVASTVPLAAPLVPTPATAPQSAIVGTGCGTIALAPSSARIIPADPAIGAVVGPNKVGTNDVWDAEEFARDFCKGAEDTARGLATDTMSLHHLDQGRLRSLCLALWRRVLMTPDARETEKLRLREEIAKELGCHSRVDQIRQLEQDLASYEVRVKIEEERVHQLGIALTCRSFGHKAAGSGAKGAAAVKIGRGGLPGRRPASAGPGARWC